MQSGIVNDYRSYRSSIVCVTDLRFRRNFPSSQAQKADQEFAGMKMVVSLREMPATSIDKLARLGCHTGRKFSQLTV